MFFPTLLLSFFIIARQVRALPFITQRQIVAPSNTTINTTTSTSSTVTVTVFQTITASTPTPTETTGPVLNTSTPARAITVLPLGDSITFGIGSADLNSYRQALQTRLADDALDIEFVGNVRSGNMTNNACVAQAGATIDQVSALADQFFASLNGTQGASNSSTVLVLPNTNSTASPSTSNSTESVLPRVVTLLAGTNDVARNVDLANAPGRVIALVNKIHAVSPNTTVLVGGIPPLALGGGRAAVDAYNAGLQTAVQASAAAGSRVAFVNMTAVTSADLADGVHPNAVGYGKIAQAWVAGMVDVIGRGLIQG